VVRAAAIDRALQSLADHQQLNAAAGAVHAAGWASLDGSIVLAREDVGRHNALDKLIGALLRTGVKPENGFVVVTSRASFEMAQKATVFGARLLAAISGPDGPGGAGGAAGGTDAGGIRAPRTDAVYTHPQRILA